MLYQIARGARRIREALAIWALFVRRIPSKIKFQYDFWKADLPLPYIWEAFSYLAGLDMRDPMETSDGLYVLLGNGLYLEIEQLDWVKPFSDPPVKERVSKFTFSQYGKQLVIQEWRTEQREVRFAEYNHVAKTNWWTVFRSGESFDVEGIQRAVQLLRRFYGEGPHDPHVPTGNSRASSN